MKKNKGILVIAFVLIALCGYFIFTTRTGTIKKELKDFAVADTASIDKLFLADRKGNKVTLIKKSPGEWIVNNKFKARNDVLNTLLYTIKSIELRSPVGKAAFDVVVKELAATGVKIEIYSGDKVLKTYYVGGPTQDLYGTFMFMEGSSVPFVMQIPGFDGYLSTRYVTLEEDWRDHNLIGFNEATLQELRIHDNEDPKNSFRLVKSGDEFSFFTPDNNSRPVPLLESQRNAYLQLYNRNINYEFVEKNLDKTHKDSVLQSVPFKILSITGTDNKTTTLSIYRMPVTERTQIPLDPETGKQIPYDRDRMYGVINNDTTLLIIQYFVFNKLFKNPVLINGPGASVDSLKK